MLIQICQVYFAFAPIYPLLAPNEDFSSTKHMAHARKYLIDFLVGGMMNGKGSV
jgi:hypothetical protein